MLRRAPGGATLTRRGAGMAVGAGVLLVADAVVGIAELATLAAVDLVVLVSAFAWIATRRWAVALQRQLQPRRGPVGTSFHVTVGLRNDGRGASPLLVVRDPGPGGRAATFRVAPLAPARLGHSVYETGPLRRGRHVVGPLEAELTDPFGLVRVTRRIGPPTVVWVHPAVERLGVLPAGGDERSMAARLAASAANGDELHALAPFTDGDDLRRVHWPSTARVGELMVRHDESETDGRVDVAVDLRPVAHDDATFEAALAAAASVVAEAAAEGVRVRLRTTAGADTGWLEPTALDVALDALAGAVMTDGPVTALAGFGDDGSSAAVLICGDGAPPPPLGGRHAAVPLVVVVERAAAASGPAVRRAGQVRVAPGRPLAPAWQAACRAGRRADAGRAS